MWYVIAIVLSSSKKVLKVLHYFKEPSVFILMHVIRDENKFILGVKISLEVQALGMAK